MIRVASVCVERDGQSAFYRQPQEKERERESSLSDPRPNGFLLLFVVKESGRIVREKERFLDSIDSISHGAGRMLVTLPLSTMTILCVCVCVSTCALEQYQLPSKLAEGE